MELTVVAKGDQLAVIGEYILSVAHAFRLTERQAYQVQTAVDEACANIIYHAYSREGEGAISLSSEMQGRDLVIVIKDSGQPFDPTAVPEPDVNAPLEVRPEGGLGVYIMRQMMDSVVYRFTAESNILTMVKRIA